jgi:hypothetical protein
VMHFDCRVAFIVVFNHFISFGAVRACTHKFATSASLPKADMRADIVRAAKCH